jgi:hypothetical protein
MSDLTERGAWFSDCRTWRYALWRDWRDLTVSSLDTTRPSRYLNFLMLNPSTADERTNDPTVERCERRARKLGYDGLLVTNLFAFRATDPKVMRAAADPIGPDNDEAILLTASRSELVICAWGAHGAFRHRSKQVLALLREAGCGDKLRALKVSGSGEPWHPLYLSYDLMPIVFT